MGPSAPGSSATVAFIFIVAVLGATHCKEIAFAKVSKLPRSPQPPPSGSGRALPAPPSQLPSALEVEVRLGETDVHLELREDQEFEPGVPVFELYTDSDGKGQMRRARLKDAEYSVYHDKAKEADFIVSREKDENGTSHYKLEGIIHLEGKLYDLKTTGRRLKRRHRQQAQAAENVGNSTDNDGGQGNDDDDDDDDEKEEEEVEVTSSPDLQAVDADYLRPPPMTQRSIEMTGTIMRPEPVDADPLPVPPSPSSSPPLPPRSSLSHLLRRKRRDVTQDIYVDVVALADYGVYKSWYDRSNGTTEAEKKEDTLENIRQYYAFVMNAVDTLYRDITSLSYTIHVKLSSVVVATTADSSSWTEQYRVSASPWDEVNANSALESVASWAATTDLLPAYDHLMLFTGYDLIKVINSVGTTSDRITGLAYTSTLCDTNGRATSIVEDLGGFQCVGTAAHELGHGLSAEHDGTENSCRSQDRYIMAAGSYEVTPTNKLNPWKFSTCSVDYFNSFLTRKVLFESGRTCLYNALDTNSNIPNVTSQVEGQLYDVDAQCRQVYGPSSRLCRGPEFGEAADVCTDMYCYDPTTASTCYQLRAARGTTCGNGKWCESGECVANSAAPSADENCVFGDQPGVAFDDEDCATFVADFPGYCYQEVVRVRCCASCAKQYRLVEGCEYGDNATGCSSASCRFAPPSYLETCCRTCDYGSTFTTTTTTTTTTPSPTTVVTAPTTTTTTTTTTTADTITTTVRNNCVDNTTIVINGLKCPALVSGNPHYCYDSLVISHCCQSCQGVATGTTGCEYGDRGPDCTAIDPNSDACSTQKSVCCKTCADYVDPTGGQSVTADVTIRVIVSCVILALVWTQKLL